MTTTPVHTITDEQIAEIEALAESACQYSQTDWFAPSDLSAWFADDDAKFIGFAGPFTVRAIINRLREAEKDAASQWIPVSERIPNPNIQVLVYGNVSKVFFALRKNRTLNPWEYLDGDTCHEKITHWMPIPTVPRKEHKK